MPMVTLTAMPRRFCSSICHRKNLKDQTYNKTKHLVSEARSLRLLGYTWTEIGRVLGVHRATVRLWAAKHRW